MCLKLCFCSWTIAPYEICPEDYAVSMLWRRTPSGELAFNRCPPNATGKKSHNSQRLKSSQPNTKTQKKNRTASQMLSKERKRTQIMFFFVELSFCSAFISMMLKLFINSEGYDDKCFSLVCSALLWLPLNGLCCVYLEIFLSFAYHWTLRRFVNIFARPLSAAVT